MTVQLKVLQPLTIIDGVIQCAGNELEPFISHPDQVVRSIYVMEKNFQNQLAIPRSMTCVLLSHYSFNLGKKAYIQSFE